MYATVDKASINMSSAILLYFATQAQIEMDDDRIDIETRWFKTKPLSKLKF